jgi:hypothetical protein
MPIEPPLAGPDVEPGPILIPRILHQTWQSNDIPEDWRAFHQSWDAQSGVGVHVLDRRRCA